MRLAPYYSDVSSILRLTYAIFSLFSNSSPAHRRRKKKKSERENFMGNSKDDSEMMQIESDLKLFLAVARETIASMCCFYITVGLLYERRKRNFVVFFHCPPRTIQQSTIQKMELSWVLSGECRRSEISFRLKFFFA